MPRYAITEKAGRFVAGTNNTGVGTILNLTEKQAEHEVRLGSLQPLDVPAASEEGGKAKKAPTGKAKAAEKPAAKEGEGSGSGEGEGSGGE